jgi:hypothetical protein
MHVIGGVEMLVGGPILVGYTGLGGYAAAVWLVGIAAHLVTTGHYFDVAVRDVIIAIAAFTLAQLTEVRASEQVRDGVGGLRLRAAKDDCLRPEARDAFHNETDPLKMKSFVRHRSPFSGRSAGSDFAQALPVTPAASPQQAIRIHQRNAAGFWGHTTSVNAWSRTQ